MCQSRYLAISLDGEQILTKIYQKINDILSKAEDGASSAYTEGWYFWLASETFPEGDPDGFLTKPPVKETPTAYLDKDFEDLSGALKQSSDKAAINRTFFAVLDERTGRDGSVALCFGKNKSQVDYIRAGPKHSSLTLRGLSTVSITWDEMKSASDGSERRGEGDVLD